MATMIGNFNDGSVAGKVQFGSAWWFFRSEGRDDKADQRAVKHGPVKPFGRYAYRFAQFSIIPPARVFPQAAL